MASEVPDSYAFPAHKGDDEWLTDDEVPPPKFLPIWPRRLED